MTSFRADKPRRPIPCMMASSGRRGVESSLKTSILPFRMTTKSVNVPPVSTPTLEIDARDILNVFGRNGGGILNRALRITLPGQGLKMGKNTLEVVHGDLARPGEIRVG